MPRGGAPHSSLHQAGQEALATRSYEYEEVAAVLSLSDVNAVQTYQLATDTQKLLETPIPVELEKHNPAGAVVLRTNTALYEDHIEDGFGADTKLREIYLLAVSQQRAELIRSRRTVMGYLAIAGTKHAENTGREDVA